MLSLQPNAERASSTTKLRRTILWTCYAELARSAHMWPPGRTARRSVAGIPDTFWARSFGSDGGTPVAKHLADWRSQERRHDR